MNKKDYWLNDSINHKFLDEEELLKIVIAFIAAGYNFFTCIEKDYQGKQKEREFIKQDIVILIRIIILYNSIKHKYPLAMCATISVIISLTQTLMLKETKDDDE